VITDMCVSFLQKFYCTINLTKPISVAARSKAWDYSRSLAGIVGSNPARGMDVCVECCQVEVSATG